MSIARLTTQEGTPLPTASADIHIAISGLLSARRNEIEMLQPGEYPVTPKIWTKHTHEHELTVLDNGEGIYRIYPRDKDVGFHMNTDAGISPFKQGGQQNYINEKNPFAMVGGGHPTKRGLQLFGIFVYI